MDFDKVMSEEEREKLMMDQNLGPPVSLGWVQWDQQNVDPWAGMD